MNTFDTLSNELIVRRTLTVFIIIDTSRSMRGNKIRTVNEVMHDITSQMRDIGGCDAKVRIVALCFNDTCSWMTPAPISIENFE